MLPFVFQIWQYKGKVLNRLFLPEFIMDATLDTVTSQSKVHIFLSSEIHVVLWVRTNKTLITLISLTRQGKTEDTAMEYHDSLSE